MSAVYIGAYAWSYSNEFNSGSACGTTTASDVSVVVSNTSSSNCSAVTISTSSVRSYGSNSYGGSISAVYIGAYAWSFGHAIISSVCGTTTASGVSVVVSNTSSSNCSAVSRGGGSNGANSYGGSMSAYIGAYAWSYSGGALGVNCVSFCDSIRTTGLLISFKNSTFSDSLALSRKLCRANNLRFEWA